jgi:hypothetical protein
MLEEFMCLNRFVALHFSSLSCVFCYLRSSVS